MTIKINNAWKIFVFIDCKLLLKHIEPRFQTLSFLLITYDSERVLFN